MTANFLLSFYCADFLTSLSCRKNAAMIESMQRPVNRYIGTGSSISPTTKLNAEAPLAKKLHTPSAVDANKVGKK